MKKSFEQWLWEDVERNFDLTRITNFPPLQQWLDVYIDIDETIEKQLTVLHKTLILHFMDWNEDELKMQFIAPLLYLVNFNDSKYYQPFSQRNLRTEVNNIELLGIVDWLLASGKQIPRAPFFFIHEYKKEKGTSNDPLGQLLSTLVAASNLNETPRTLYGAYIIGKDWYFVTLKGGEYSVSLPYGTTDFGTLKKVFVILQNVKKLIVSNKK